MYTNNWQVLIVDMPHREEVFAEVWIKNEQWAEVFLKDGKPMIEVFARREGETWQFSYQDLIDITEKINTFISSLPTE